MPLFVRRKKGKVRYFFTYVSSRSLYNISIHGFIVLPLSLEIDLTIPIGFRTMPVRLAISPFSLVLATIIPDTSPMPMVESILPLSRIILLARCVVVVGESIRATAMAFPIRPFANVFGAVGPSELPLAISQIVLEGSVVNTSVVVTVDPPTVALVAFEFSAIAVAIGKGRTPQSMPSAITPVKIII
jgi:hypothetical protein